MPLARHIVLCVALGTYASLLGQTHQTCLNAGFNAFDNYGNGNAAAGVCIWENPPGSGNTVCSWGNSSISWELACRNNCPEAIFYFGTGSAGKDYCLNVILPLPIELVDFKAENKGPFNMITWKTNSEINSDYYVLFNSTDGMDWQTIVVMQGAGNSDRELTYEANHYGPDQGMNYYKLQQFDYDGYVSEYGPIGIETKSVHLEARFSDCYPNPSTNAFYFQYTGLNTQQAIELNIINMLGEIVQTATFDSFNKYQGIAINTDHLPTGYYHVVLKQAEHMETKKIAIVH